VRKGTWVDVGLGTLYIGLYSIPAVLAGILAIGFLASRDFLHAFPVSGLSSGDASSFAFLPHRTEAGFEPGWLLDRLWHVALPVMCLVYGGFAVLSKQTRAAMLENFNADYVRTARAKGVASHDVTFRHVFRNSLLPLITMFVTIFPAMLAGSVVIERVFSVRGMGWFVVEAISWRDRELILANTVIVAVVNLVALLLADLLYALADPRVTFD
jgi:peptide/nickel transport system permease protein